MFSVSKKGQVTLSAILEFLIVIIMYTAIYKPFNDILNQFKTSDPVLNAIIGFIPILMYLVIILGFAWYVFPKREVINE